jgi:hypothetical protein
VHKSETQSAVRMKLEEANSVAFRFPKGVVRSEPFVKRNSLSESKFGID